jgi:hypothetical protein
MFVPCILLLGAWLAVRATAEARYWLTHLRSAGPISLARLGSAARSNVVLNNIPVARRASAKAETAEAGLPGPKQ